MLKRIVCYVPNALTLFRIGCIPCIVCTFYFDTSFAKRTAAIIFVISSITDFLDGYIARKFNAQSAFGIILDPLADKIVISSTLLMIVKYKNINEISCIILLASPNDSAFTELL